MFENISFYSYEIPGQVTPTRVAHELSDHSLFLLNQKDSSAIPENMQHADFRISGKMESFFRPPLTESVLHDLYHLESFSIFSAGYDFFTRRHDYSSYLILYTYEGNGILEYEGKTYELSAGDGFFIDCMKPHFYQTNGTHWKHSVLHFNGPLLASLYTQFLSNQNVCFSQKLNGSYHTALERLLTIYSSLEPYRDYAAADCISSIVTDLLVHSYQCANDFSSMPENLRYLTRYMEQHFSETLTLDFLSEFSGISKYYLSREFKKYTGFSPNDYLIMLRIDHAKTLLTSTTLPANKIAHMVGIHDLNNFTNLFKKKTGKTPGLYRKEMA